MSKLVREARHQSAHIKKENNIDHESLKNVIKALAELERLEEKEIEHHEKIESKRKLK